MIRAARENDLDQIHTIFYLNEIQGINFPPPPGDISPTLRHILQTGRLFVAEQDTHILAFAGAITRGPTTFLTDLFVHPESQSAGLGKLLLQHILPQNSSIHCTMSSTDPRAQALYIRSGMQPKFPNFNLQCKSSTVANLPHGLIEVIEGDPAAPELVQWDTKISGRERVLDHTFWVKEQQAVPLWFLRKGVTLGYGYVRLHTNTLWHPEVCIIGPIGVNSAEYATDCILAAVNWACKRADVVRIDVPGPHPCLATLLDIGFHITYVELFVSNEVTPLFDARRYIPSGSDLL